MPFKNWSLNTVSVLKRAADMVLPSGRNSRTESKRYCPLWCIPSKWLCCIYSQLRVFFTFPLSLSLSLSVCASLSFTPLLHSSLSTLSLPLSLSLSLSLSIFLLTSLSLFHPLSCSLSCIIHLPLCISLFHFIFSSFFLHSWYCYDREVRGRYWLHILIDYFQHVQKKRKDWDGQNS